MNIPHDSPAPRPYTVIPASKISRGRLVGLKLLWGKIDDLQEPLLPQEIPLVERAGVSRRREVTASRTLAHYAMKELGVPPQPILWQNRAPLWPEGLWGSITHTSSHCAVVIARTNRVASLGIDLEMIGRVRHSLWKHVLNSSEREKLERADEAWQPLASTIHFSAKEAFFKLQFPLSGGKWVDFEEVTVVADPDGFFTLTCSASLPGIPPILNGVWLQPVPGFILCLLAIPARMG